ncbi:DNA polymerase III subunit epsilon [Ideonella dechloratans]|uniref:DNA polymerase III subunit epsilon n=1 Tax=Ideonella dechloratans TaxID=36863 RepID=UPI0035B28825
MRQIFLDTETTGLSPDSGDRIVEIGCVEMVNRRLTGNNRHFYLNPERKNNEEAVRVHGLTDEFLADKPLFSAVADDLITYWAGAEIIIHNAAFDVGFLDAEFRRIGKPLFHAHVASVTDSLLMARDMFPGKSNSLDALCKRLEVDNSSRTLHGALLDAELLAEVYIRMTRGQGSLVIDASEGGDGPTLELGSQDLSSFALPLVAVADAELAAHAQVMKSIDKTGEVLALWEKAMA